MNGYVNYFWAPALVRYLKIKKIPTSRVKECLRVPSGSQHSLTLAQAAYVLDTAVSLSGDELLGLRCALESKIIDYRFIGMLLCSAPNPISILKDESFLSRYIIQQVRVTKTMLPCGELLSYELPSEATNQAYVLLGQFILYATKCIEQNCSHIKLLRLSVNDFEVQKFGGGDWNFRRVVSGNKVNKNLQCKVLYEINSSASGMEVGVDESDRADVYSDLHALVDRNKRYLLSCNLPDQVIHLAYQNIQNSDFSYQWVAKHLGMCERNLQKKLKDYHTSYRELVDDVRKDLAERYLVKEKRSVTDTAFMLGYTATSNFIRAYRRWWGCSPLSTIRSSNDSVQNSYSISSKVG